LQAELAMTVRGFVYQIENYRTTHDLENPPDDIDIIELSTLGEYLTKAAV
jgi:hypothetical protein